MDPDQTSIEPSPSHLCAPAPRSDSHLPMVMDPRAVRRHAAWRGALAIGLPGAATVALVPWAYTTLFPLAWVAVHTLLPQAVAPYISLGLLFCAPALVSLPFMALGAWASRRAARRSRDLGLATAAGVGIATTAVTLGAIVLHAASPSVVILQAPLFAAAALTVGLVGGASFAAVPPEPGEDEEERVPSLYHGAMAAGLGGPLLLAGAAAWAALAWLFPFLSPTVMKSVLATPLAEGATVALALAGLSPLSWFLARVFRRGLPRGGGGPLAAGLLFPAVIPTFGLLGIMLTNGIFDAVHLSMLFGCVLGAAPHLLGVLLGLRRADPGRERLPGAAASPTRCPAPEPVSQ